MSKASAGGVIAFLSSFIELAVLHWNRSKLDTTGREESVLNSEVSLFPGLLCKSVNVGFGAGKIVLFMEVSSIQGCPY